VLALLKRSRGLSSAVVRGRIGTRSLNHTLQSLERSLTSSTALPASEIGQGRRDGVLDLLGAADDALSGPSARRQPAKPMLAALPASRRSPATATGVEAPGPGISRESIRKVVVRGSKAIRRCYEQELLTSAIPLEGRLLLRWRIDARGRVQDLTVVKDNLGSAALTRCIKQKIATWRFPACSGRSCVVVYPFDFFPRMS
jgi:hypothetical protein